MTHLFAPSPPANQGDCILCSYMNATSQIQIARISNVPRWYFERVVFPGERLLFETVPKAQLEIHTGIMPNAILADKIPCSFLLVKEGSRESCLLESEGK